MEHTLKIYGPNFEITGKRMGWHIGVWKEQNCPVMLRPIDEEDFIFCSLIPKSGDIFDPFTGVPKQTWYAWLQGVLMEISEEGAQTLMDTKLNHYDCIPEILPGKEILVRGSEGNYDKCVVEEICPFEKGLCIQYREKSASEKYVLLDEYGDKWKFPV